MFTLPKNYWASDDIHNWQAYAEHWETRLRGNVSRQPDPAMRFSEWLESKKLETNKFGGVKLVFYEQPYLAWAQDVEKIIEAKEKSTRELCAYEITHRNED